MMSEVAHNPASAVAPARSLYVASTEGRTGKSVVALGLVDLLVARVGRLGVFRPVSEGDPTDDDMLELLRNRAGQDRPIAAGCGVTYEEVHRDPEGALAAIVDAYRVVEERSDVVVVVGSDYTAVPDPAELSFNGRIAANLGSPVVVVLKSDDRSPSDVFQAAEIALAELNGAHATTAGLVANRCSRDDIDELVGRLSGLGRPAWALPEVPLLNAPLVGDVMAALDGELILGDPALLEREAESTLICAMGVDHVLERLADGQLCIAPGDRSGLLLSLGAANASSSAPSLAALVVNGGFRPTCGVIDLLGSFDQGLPVISVEADSLETARIATATRGRLRRSNQRKVDVALSLFDEHIEERSILSLFELPRSDVVTPLMFESLLMERAKVAAKHLVLPEGDDDRILRAASTLLSRGVVELTLLGDIDSVRSRAASMGLDIDAAEVIDPLTSELRGEFASQYAQLRSHKGVTEDAAFDFMADVSYFATMMVHTEMVDGMVSGAAHSTAHTITPAFEIIRTAPGFDVVSSVFFMCLEDRVLVYGDCAIVREPDSAELADIAVASAETASRFGVTPRVAMLSYSTGTSGAGAEVDKVRAATELVRRRRPDLLVEGPMQYDAAVDAAVAESKMPSSAVAGRATVFVFPDLNTGNNTYKAVQRTAGAVAIGPVLQGLAKPVNDVSRGATVRDIINTISITAAQAAYVE